MSRLSTIEIRCDACENKIEIITPDYIITEYDVETHEAEVEIEKVNF